MHEFFLGCLRLRFASGGIDGNACNKKNDREQTDEDVRQRRSP